MNDKEIRVFKFPEGSIWFGPAGHRKMVFTRQGWDWCCRFNSFLHWLALETKIGRLLLRLM